MQLLENQISFQVEHSNVSAYRQTFWMFGFAHHEYRGRFVCGNLDESPFVHLIYHSHHDEDVKNLNERRDVRFLFVKMNLNPDEDEHCHPDEDAENLNDDLKCERTPSYFVLEFVIHFFHHAVNATLDSVLNEDFHFDQIAANHHDVDAKILNETRDVQLLLAMVNPNLGENLVSMWHVAMRCSIHLSHQRPLSLFQLMLNVLLIDANHFSRKMVLCFVWMIDENLIATILTTSIV